MGALGDRLSFYFQAQTSCRRRAQSSQAVESGGHFGKDPLHRLIFGRVDRSLVYSMPNDRPD